MTYRLGVLGLGNRARTLIRAASCSGHFDVTVVSDARDEPHQPPGPAMAEAPHAEYVESWRDLLARDLDAVVVAVPNDRHRDLVIAALEAGLHVLCEKPIGASLDDIRDILEAARRSESVLHVGMELRYAPYVQELLARTADGTLAEPRMLWAQEFRTPFRPGAGGWRMDPQRSGGTLLEKNCHHFDVFCLVTGERPVSVSAAGVGEVAGMLDHATVSVEFCGGAVGSLAVSMTQDDSCLRLGALGAGWHYEYDSRGEVSKVRRAGVETRYRWTVDTRGLDAGGWDHPGEVEQFAAFAARIAGDPDATAERISPLWGHLVSLAAELSVRERSLVRITSDGGLE